MLASVKNNSPNNPIDIRAQTFPQVYIKGELIGGCDITLELFESGELKQMIESAAK